MPIPRLYNGRPERNALASGPYELDIPYGLSLGGLYNLPRIAFELALSERRSMRTMLVARRPFASTVLSLEIGMSASYAAIIGCLADLMLEGRMPLRGVSVYSKLVIDV